MLEAGILVLIRDDPVQSMDDVHIVNLARVLRDLTKQTGRQLILGIHERSMYEYLQLELGPTSEGESLASVEVLRVGNKSSVTSSRVTWKEDEVRFGT